MTEKPLSQWPKWRNDLMYHLRMRDVPGDRIGDILLEVEEHIHETGETPEEALGPSKTYAESRSSVLPSHTEKEAVNPVSQILIPGLGSFLLATGAFELGAGEESWGSTRSWLMLVVGAALLTWVFIHLPIDLIRDPRSGNALFKERRELTLIMLSTVVVAAGLMYAVGRLIA